MATASEKLVLALGDSRVLWYTFLMSTNKYISRYLSIVVASFVLWQWGAFGAPLAHAQDLNTSIITIGSLVIGMIITALHFLMFVLFDLLNIVTDPNLIFQQGMVTILFNVWKVFRDLVNYLFAILLIVGALITVVTASTEKVKTILPKFVMAIILVNFSWFIPRVIYDFSTVIAYTVYQLPKALLPAGETCMVTNLDGSRSKCVVLNDYRYFDQTDSVTHGQQGWDCTLKPLLCVQWLWYDDPAVGQRWNDQSIIHNGLVANYAQLQSLGTILSPVNNAGNQPVPTKALLTWLIKITVVLVIHIALFFPLLALVAAYFIRIPILWLTMAFMPFVALGFVVDQLNWLVEEIGKQFIKVAFLPAMVGIPFSIGFILINIGSKVPIGPDRPFLLTIGIESFNQIFWLVLSLGVLWVGVFAALKKGGDYVNHFTDTIKGMGEATGKAAIAAPLNARIIPGVGSPMAAFKSANQKLQQLVGGGAGTDMNKLRGALITKDHIENKFHNNTTVNAIVENKAYAAGAGQQQLKDALKELRKVNTQLENLTDEDTLKAYFERMKELNKELTDAQKKRFQDTLAGKASAATP